MTDEKKPRRALKTVYSTGLELVGVAALAYGASAFTWYASAAIVGAYLIVVAWALDGGKR